ncbi:hypothetical protein ACFRNJ_41895 [Streptomyces sp. NPDC056721]|uniref:hypothetical protein n=1 Tax=Streptomyces sp. NPDC056721 TaxID=3345923 RepID=UPI0036AC99E7
MSDTFSHPHPVRRATLTLVAVLAFTVAVLAVIWGPGVPDAWWPQTGNAFAAEHIVPATPSTAAAPESDPCDLIVGPAKAYCLRSDSHIPPAKGEFCWAGALRLALALLGLAVLLNCRRRQS